MAHSSNQNKYDSLLNQFLNNDNSVEKDESDQMQEWLEEASNRLRNQFEVYRGKITNKSDKVRIRCIYLDNDTKIKHDAKEIELSRNNSDELEMAMCVSLPSDSSDEDDTYKKKVVLISLFVL